MILHVDMDAFYASVEQLDNPELRGKCVIVGGTSGRGVVSAASYEARRCGVHSAMPVFQAREKCPEGVFVHPRMSRYKEKSREVMHVLREFTPEVEPVSIDEAYLDVTGCIRLFGPPETIARQIKARIRKDTGLTCSIGIAPVKFLAKIASDMDKPDGLTMIPADQVGAFIQSLDIRKVPGVGPTTEPVLRNLGIHTLGDIRSIPEQTLSRHMGKFGKRLQRLAAGDDESPVETTTEAHSISSENTLSRDTRDLDNLQKHMLRQAETVARQLRRKFFKARTVQLKMKTADFKQVTRQSTLEQPTDSGRTIYNVAVDLLQRHLPEKKLRLIGVGAVGLVSTGAARQASLFEEPAVRSEGWEKTDRALDRIAKRFGREAVTRASLVEPKAEDDDAR